MGKDIFFKSLTNEQKDFLKFIDINLDSDDLTQIEDEIFYYMQDNGFTNDEPNEIGIKCEEILDIISGI